MSTTLVAPNPAINGFRLAKTARGYSLTFKEAGKTRRIIFVSGTIPFNWIDKEHENIAKACEADSTEPVIRFIHGMKGRGYRFMANKSNKSVFYPTK
jgi:hypothetical protein